MEYAREADKLRRLDTLREEINRIQTSIQSIKDRIENYKSSACPICIDNLQNPVTVSCCNNVFCFECMTRSLERKYVCPMCRTEISHDCLTVIGNPDEHQSKNSDELPSKDEAFLKLLEMYKKGKFLVFSAHDQSFYGIECALKKVDRPCVKLVGSGHRIKNILHDYKHGELDVLLLNANHYGTGLNLENTTDLVFYHKMSHDMEQQVIGRAQRFGRTTSLRIHYLFHEMES
jgi:SNF2 family DNA or RNA helicase